MKKIRLFQLVSVFALALLIGFAFTTTNNTKTVKSDNIETIAMANIQADIANVDSNISKCGEGKCGEAKTSDKKKTKKKSNKKKDCDKKTDKKTTETKCGGC